jgi:hypothetical protein
VCGLYFKEMELINGKHICTDNDNNYDNENVISCKQLMIGEFKCDMCECIAKENMYVVDNDEILYETEHGDISDNEEYKEKLVFCENCIRPFNIPKNRLTNRKRVLNLNVTVITSVKLDNVSRLVIRYNTKINDNVNRITKRIMEMCEYHEFDDDEKYYNIKSLYEVLLKYLNKYDKFAHECIVEMKKEDAENANKETNDGGSKDNVV